MIRFEIHCEIFIKGYSRKPLNDFKRTKKKNKSKKLRNNHVLYKMSIIIKQREIIWKSFVQKIILRKTNFWLDIKKRRAVGWREFRTKLPQNSIRFWNFLGFLGHFTVYFLKSHGYVAVRKMLNCFEWTEHDIKSLKNIQNCKYFHWNWIKSFSFLF